MPSAPSEKQLAAALHGLDAAGLQRIAEAVFLRDPERNLRVVPYGRTHNLKTRTGRPDIILIEAGGDLQAVEVTADKRNWRTHLREDIEYFASGRGGAISGFWFVALARTPTPGELDELRIAGSALGLPDDRVRLIFQEELVSLLRQPRFAKEWADPLSLSTSAWPFVRIGRAAVYGASGLEYFAPSKTEYDRGDVHLPQAAEEIAGRLESKSFALVVGRGAAGKTVVATALALRNELQGFLSYYLDLGATSPSVSPRDGLAAMTMLGDRGVLFVLDNGHLDEALAAEFLDHWRAQGSGAALLITKRESEYKDRSRGIASPLAAAEDEAVRLSPSASDLLGVYERVMGRINPLSVRPPSDVLRAWVRTFTGDLIAFSAGVAHRRPGPGDWRLTPQDAASYMRSAYLDTRTHDQRAQLLRVAAVSAYETSMPTSLVASSLIQDALRSGIVVRTDAGVATAHPGLGRLLIAAADPGERAVATSSLTAAARADPDSGLRLARKIRWRESPTLVREVTRVSVESDETVVLRVRDLARVLPLFNDAGISLPSLEERLIALPDDTLWKAINEYRGSMLLTRLAEIDRDFPRLSDRYASLLHRPGYRERLVENLVSVPPGGLSGQLKRLRTKWPTFYAPALEALADVNSLTYLLGKAQPTSTEGFDELRIAANRSSSFEDALVGVVSRNPLVGSQLISRRDGGTFLHRLARASDRLTSAFVALRATPEFRGKQLELAVVGPRALLNVLGDALAYEDAALIRDVRSLVEARRGDIRRWRRYPTGLAELLARADAGAPELAALLRAATAPESTVE